MSSSMIPVGRLSVYGVDRSSALTNISGFFWRIPLMMRIFSWKLSSLVRWNVEFPDSDVCAALDACSMLMPSPAA
jgi:hypothetical protein